MPANNSTKITLTEDDIAGASLRIKTASNLTIPELKKKAKLSGPKQT